MYDPLLGGEDGLDNVSDVEPTGSNLELTVGATVTAPAAAVLHFQRQMRHLATMFVMCSSWCQMHT